MIATLCQDTADYVDPMSDDLLTNAAVRWFRSNMDRNNALLAPPSGPSVVTDDFVYEDRQTGGVNMGRIDASGWQQFHATAWQVNGRGPHFSISDVIAVRGQRSAAFIIRIDYGDENFSESLSCFRLDPTLELMHRLVAFDNVAVHAAIAELDRMHAEIDD